MSAQGDSAQCVLIVDDEEDIRESLREVIEMGGCSVLLAANGVEALAVLRERQPCLVILDLRMPVMDGNELMEAMRKDPSLSELSVVVSTSAPERAPRGVPILPKPIDITAVWDWMRRSCRCGHAAPSRV